VLDSTETAGSVRLELQFRKTKATYSSYQIQMSDMPRMSVPLLAPQYHA